MGAVDVVDVEEIDIQPKIISKPDEKQDES
jgi:hypothetical protein